MPEKNSVDQALKNMIATLPEQPQWVMLLTRDNEFIRHWDKFIISDSPTKEDLMISSLTHKHALEEIKLLSEISHGTFQFTISIGADGIYFIFHLNDRYLLGISYQHVGVRSIDAVVNAVTTNFYSLLEALS